MSSNLVYAALCCVLLFAGAARAQWLPTPMRARPQAVTIGVSIDPALIVSAAYSYTIRFGPRRPELSLGASLQLPPLTLGERIAFRDDLLVASRWLFHGGWGVALQARGYLVGDTSDTGEYLGLGLELRAHPGYTSWRWAGGLDLGWQGTLLTRIRHSELTRRTFTDRDLGGATSDLGGGPVDGWYGSAAHRFRIGLAGGYAPLDWLALQLSLGTLFSIQAQGVLYNLALAQIPVYLEVGVRFSF